jgi:hypothetical protein
VFIGGISVNAPCKTQLFAGATLAANNARNYSGLADKAAPMPKLYPGQKKYLR